MNKDEFQRTAQIKDQYIYDLYDDENGDFVGATNLKILGFKDNMDMYIGYPWGEVGIFEMTEKRVNDGSLPRICEIYDYDLHEFELLVGKNIRARINSIGNGFNSSKCNLKYNEDRFIQPIDMDSETYHQYPEVGTYENEEPFQIEIDNIWDLIGKATAVIGFIILFFILIL